MLNPLLRHYDIRVLQCGSNATDLLTIVSLKPIESISSCASKLKGRVSKWLKESLSKDQPLDLLSKGYFACTIGKSKSQTVEKYLSRQAEHHGYAGRILPPIFMQQYQLSLEDMTQLSAKHAMVVSQFHLVLSTSRRRGILGSREGQEIAERWRSQQNQLRIAFLKVSFVPDHVHMLFRAHPSVVPAEVAAALMNSAQEAMQYQMIQAGLDRLWEPSVYLGSYGDLASGEIRKYIENWEKGR